MTDTPTPMPGTATTNAYAPDALLTLREIADLRGRDLSTIKYWNDQGGGKWPNAVQDKDGRRTWRVPVSDLAYLNRQRAALHHDGIPAGCRTGYAVRVV